MSGSNLKLLLFVIFAAITVGGLVLINSVLQERIAPDDASASYSNSFVLNQVLPEEGTELFIGDAVEVGVASQLPTTDNSNNPSVAEIFLNFDSDALTVTGIRLGQDILALNENLDNDLGTVSVDISYAGAGGFKGANNLVIFQFEVKDDSLSGATISLDPDKTTYGFPNVLDSGSGVLDLVIAFDPIAEDEEEVSDEGTDTGLAELPEEPQPDELPEEEEYPSIEEPELTACTADVKECDDGSFVSRDPDLGCQFRDCPEVVEEEEVTATMVPETVETSICGNNICEIDEDEKCSEDCVPSFTPSTSDTATEICMSFVYSDWSSCLDGRQYRKVINRIPEDCTGGSPILSRSCVVEGQPESGSTRVCAQDVSTCPDGSIVQRDPLNGCEFVCPGLSECRPLPDCAYGQEVSGSILYCDLDSAINWCGYECTPLPRCAYGIDGQATCSLAGGIDWCDRLPGKAESNVSQVCVADYDGSGTIDLADLSLFAKNYKQQDIDCDLDITGDDCRLDIQDFKLFGQYYKELNICLGE